jgi:hypothetical protein
MFLLCILEVIGSNLGQDMFFWLRFLVVFLNPADQIPG